MRHALTLALLRFAPTRWVWAIAVTLYAIVRSLPAHARHNARALTPRKRPASAIRALGKGHGKRSRKGVTRFRNDVRTKLGQLRAERHARAAKLYLQALADLTARGEKVSAERREAARDMARLTAMELRSLGHAELETRRAA